MIVPVVLLSVAIILIDIVTFVSLARMWTALNALEAALREKDAEKALSTPAADAVVHPNLEDALEVARGRHPIGL